MNVLALDEGNNLRKDEGAGDVGSTSTHRLSPESALISKKNSLKQTADDSISFDPEDRSMVCFTVLITSSIYLFIRFLFKVTDNRVISL